MSLDRVKLLMSISQTHFSPAACWQEFGILISFRSISQEWGTTGAVKHRCFPVKYDTGLVVLEPVCPNIQNIAVNLHKLAVQSTADLIWVYHLCPLCRPAATQQPSFLLSALSSSKEPVSNVLLTVFGSSTLGLFLIFKPRRSPLQQRSSYSADGFNPLRRPLGPPGHVKGK